MTKKCYTRTAELRRIALEVTGGTEPAVRKLSFCKNEKETFIYLRTYNYSMKLKSETRTKYTANTSKKSDILLVG